MEEKQKFTVSVYTENNIGLLNRLSAIFLKRHINIESMTVCKSEIENVSRFTFVVIVPESLIKKVAPKLHKRKAGCSSCARRKALLNKLPGF